MDTRTWVRFSHSETADTPIVEQIAAKRRNRTRLTRLLYTAQGTAHDLTVLTSLARTTVATAAAAEQADVELAEALDLEAGDYIVLRLPDGTGFWSTVNAWDASTLVVTLDDDVPEGGISAGADVWLLGAVADHADKVLNGIASSTTDYHANGNPLVAGGVDEPLMLHSDNATAAGTLQIATGDYEPGVA